MTAVDTDAIVGLAHRACTLAGIPAHSIEPIRIRDNWMLRIPGAGTVIRIHPPGRLAVAVRELRAADWLRSHQVPTAEPLPPDPVTVADRPATFWSDLGSNGPAEPKATARALLRLHSLRVPDHLALPRFELPDRRPRIAAALTDDRTKKWLTNTAEDHARRWAALDNNLNDWLSSFAPFGNDGVYFYTDINYKNVFADMNPWPANADCEWVGTADNDKASSYHFSGA